MLFRYPASILEDPLRVSAHPPAILSQAPVALSQAAGPYLVRSRPLWPTSTGSSSALCSGNWARQVRVDHVDVRLAVSPHIKDSFGIRTTLLAWDSATTDDYLLL